MGEDLSYHPPPIPYHTLQQWHLPSAPSYPPRSPRPRPSAAPPLRSGWRPSSSSTPSSRKEAPQRPTRASTPSPATRPPTLPRARSRVHPSSTPSEPSSSSATPL